jgi:site-specific DNA-cytosine methylase
MLCVGFLIEGNEMKILVACEESQAVTIELRNLGHEAFSADIIDCSGGHPKWHIKGDVLEILNDGWDMIIAFPPCTHLSAAGAPSWKQKQADGRQQAAIDFVYKIRDADCPMIAIENPTGKLNTSWRKPDQIVNPFQFGDPFKKRTCLWLKGLPRLMNTDLVEALYHYTSNSTRGGLLKDGTRKKSELPIYKAWDSAKDRSKTFPGIAKAMANQWAGRS